MAEVEEVAEAMVISSSSCGPLYSRGLHVRVRVRVRVSCGPLYSRGLNKGSTCVVSGADGDVDVGVWFGVCACGALGWPQLGGPEEGACLRPRVTTESTSSSE